MKTNFNPPSHGYTFPNRFEFKGLSRIVKIIKSNFIYGMCGGMVFSAMDYYFDQNKLPNYKAVEELPLSYTKYLWKRQTQSVSISVLMKIIKFASLSVSKSMQKTFQDELPKIIERLDDGLPAPIVIIRSSFFQNPTHNHQVLATGYEDNGLSLDLELYDPNHPNICPLLMFHHKQEYFITQSTGEPVRGLFLNKYLYQFSLAKPESN